MINLSHEILNEALSFSMEFGENWLVPINKRLSKIYPGLSNKELDNCDLICKQVNKIANSYVYDNPILTDQKYSFVNFEQFEIFINAQFDWISTKNLTHLYSQSCYYASK
ncbi:hypothetical protein BD847_1020 [Flavobacterium cutihirudinis]|uniref:Uncharacterized protein n=1 Tax=Flavobacterium cutihirudinis TaxID=1265740 RepID=A0A3D9G3F2_9FLAO|nr:hypothetical protein [Flavobacterium cutihirudinis]RED27087.1 hypothetical protein BD847_1020 [Flavobacterium cutihirudinis]